MIVITDITAPQTAPIFTKGVYSGVRNILPTIPKLFPTRGRHKRAALLSSLMMTPEVRRPEITMTSQFRLKGGRKLDMNFHYWQRRRVNAIHMHPVVRRRGRKLSRFLLLSNNIPLFPVFVVYTHDCHENFDHSYNYNSRSVLPATYI